MTPNGDSDPNGSSDNNNSDSNGASNAAGDGAPPAAVGDKRKRSKKDVEGAKRGKGQTGKKQKVEDRSDALDEDEIACDDDCLNRIMNIECIAPKSKGDRNNYINCNCGEEDCGNRRLQNRQYPRVQPQKEPGRGWGLVAIDGVKAGDLVTEYVGEILHRTTVAARLKQHEIDHPNNPNFYIMELDHEWFLDARVKGNMAR